MNARLLSLVAFLLASAVARGETAAPAAEPRWAGMPWHLADIFWDVECPTNARVYSMTVTVEGLVPGDIPIYIAPVGGVESINGQTFYGGMQTRADGGDLAGGSYGEIGPAFIFSRWGDREPENIRMTEGGFCQSSGHEGDFVSVRAPYPWKPGRYVFRWTELERETTPDGEFTWVGLSVRDVARDRERPVGALRFRGAGLRLGGPLSSFIEIYGGPRPASSVTEFTVTFSDPRADDRPIPIRGVQAQFECGVPALATVTAPSPREIRVRVAGPPARRPRGESVQNVALPSAPATP